MVSRGYLKISFAYERLKFDPKDKICVDVGCSTGGFTEFLLEKGARKVYAIDIGKGVLHPSLRDKVVLMEGIDAKKVRKDMFDELPEFATVDVSFSSSVPIIRAFYFVPEILVLCKPNFEVPRKYVKGGVLKDRRIISFAIMKVIMNVSDIFGVREITYSYPPGADGNIEFFIWFDKALREKIPSKSIIDKVIDEGFDFIRQHPA